MKTRRNKNPKDDKIWDSTTKEVATKCDKYRDNVQSYLTILSYMLLHWKGSITNNIPLYEIMGRPNI